VALEIASPKETLPKNVARPINGYNMGPYVRTFSYLGLVLALFNLLGALASVVTSAGAIAALIGVLRWVK
jgi:hypothetical protein